MRRALVAGWFSFTEVIATVGDERGAEVVGEWLTAAGLPYDVAYADYLRRGLDLAAVDPADYSHLVWVCGPVMADPLVDGLLDRFASARRLAVGVSVVDDVAPARFHRVWARDGDGGRRPDLAAAPPVRGAERAGTPLPGGVPVVATVFAPVQAEYGDRGRHLEVQAAVEQWIADRGLGSFDVATDLLTPAGTPRRVGQVQAALGRADVVVSSRLHGLVLALGQGRPVIACDPVRGGAKVGDQAAALGWPVLLRADEVTGAALDAASARCRGTGVGPDWPRVVRELAELQAEVVAELM